MTTIEILFAKAREIKQPGDRKHIHRIYWATNRKLIPMHSRWQVIW
jgi:hypothetical protein